MSATLGSSTSAASGVADTITVPASRTGLTATVASPTEIDLGWAAVTGAFGYQIESQASGGSWEVIDIVNAPSVSYSDVGIAEATSYGYRVSAYNDSGTSDPSDVVSKTTPHSIAGAPANVTAVALSDSQIEIVWQNTATNESGFDVQRADGSGGWIDLGTTAAGVTEYRDSGLTPATSYGYQVFAVNSAGQSAAGSASATTPAAPASDAAPAQPTLTATAASSSEIDLAWSAPTDGSHLELEEQAPGNSNFSVVPIPSPTTVNDQPVYAITGLTASTQYSFRLRADLNGLASYSATTRAITSHGGSVDPTVPVPYDLTASPADPGSGAGLNLTFQWDGDPEVAGWAFQAQTMIINPQDPYGLYRSATTQSISGTISDSGQVTATTDGFTPAFKLRCGFRMAPTRADGPIGLALPKQGR